MTPAPQEPARTPRAAAYARANQGVDRYHHSVQRAGGRTRSAAPQRRFWSPRNRKRFWFFTVVLVFAAVAGATTLNAVFAAAGRVPDEPAARGSVLGAGARREQPLIASPPDGQAQRGTTDGGPPDRRPPALSTAAIGAATPAAAGSARSGGPDGAAGHGSAASSRPAGPVRGSGAERSGRGGPGSAGRAPYHNCGQVRRAGAAPLRRGQPGYTKKLDPDGDGVACAG